MLTFLNRILTVFLVLVNPVSSAEKPKCIMNTNIVATSIHKLFTVKSSNEFT